MSSPNCDRGRNASPPAGGRIRSYTFGPLAAEAMSRERKATRVAKDMDGKGLEGRRNRVTFGLDLLHLSQRLIQNVQSHSDGMWNDAIADGLVVESV